MTIDKVSKLPIPLINRYLSEGARFVRFTYVISIIAVTYKRESKVFFIRKGESAITKGLPYTLISVILGWWGIPYGIVYTIGALIRNAKGRTIFSGEEITEEILEAMKKESDSKK